MSKNSKIEWTDHTFNPWEGCQKVGPGCDHCYAEARNARFGGGTPINWGPRAPRRRTSPETWRKPVQWNRDGAFYALHGRRQRVFCASLADVFDSAVPNAWRADLAMLIKQTENIDWLLLTKRIGNALPMLCLMFPEGVPANVWIGATIVNRDEMLRDAERLLAVPASVHFWSVEPLLGDLGEIPVALMPDWVICGGESGSNARPMHPEWALSLRDQCAAAAVPFLFKQWGEWIPMMGHAEDIPVRGPKFIHSDGTIMGHAGKRAAGRLLDGRTHDEFPQGAA